MKDPLAKAAPILPIIPVASQTEQANRQKLGMYEQAYKQKKADEEANKSDVMLKLKALPTGLWGQYTQDILDKENKFIDLYAEHRKGNRKPTAQELIDESLMERDIKSQANGATYIVKLMEKQHEYLSKDYDNNYDTEESYESLAGRLTGKIEDDMKMVGNVELENYLVPTIDINKFINSQKLLYKSDLIITPVVVKDSRTGNFVERGFDYSLNPEQEDRLKTTTQLYWDKNKDRKLKGMGITLSEQYDGNYEKFYSAINDAVVRQQNYGYGNEYQQRGYGGDNIQLTTSGQTGKFQFYYYDSQKKEQAIRDMGSVRNEARLSNKSGGDMPYVTMESSANLLNAFPVTAEAEQKKRDGFLDKGGLQVKPYAIFISEDERGDPCAYVRVQIQDPSDQRTLGTKIYSYVVPYEDVKAILNDSDVNEWLSKNMKNIPKKNVQTTKKTNVPLNKSLNR